MVRYSPVQCRAVEGVVPILIMCGTQCYKQMCGNALYMTIHTK